MTVTLYQPGVLPQELSALGFTLDASNGVVMQDHILAAQLLGCAPELVDVLACGRGYVVYTVFDCEGPVNEAVMHAVTELSGVSFQQEDDDEVLRGPGLVVTA